MDDKEIMAALEKDPDRWYCLVIDRYTPYVTAVIGGMAKGALAAGDVEEVAADVFYKVWLRREKILAEGMKALIAQIARNATVDRLRKARAEWMPYEDDVLQVACPQSLDELAIAREQMAIVERAVADFGEPDREIFIRYYYFGETVKTIAGRLRLNAATTKTKLYRLRARLKEIMRERGYGCE